MSDDKKNPTTEKKGTPIPKGEKPWSTGCLAKVDTQEEYDEVMMTVPKTKSPKSLADFGYTFNEEGKLVQRSNGKPFAWLGQKHYDKLGDALIEDIYVMLEKQFNLQRVAVPFGAPKDVPQCPIFVSSDFETADVSVILCQGSGAVRPGMWARALCINDSLEVGTIFTYLKAIQERGWGVAVLNPNENGVVLADIAEPLFPVAKGAKEETVEEYWLNTPDAIWKKFSYFRMSKEEEIEGNSCPEEHMIYVWDNLVAKKAKATMVPIIAHSYGGKATTALARNRLEEVAARVPAVALTDAINDTNVNRHQEGFVKFMKKRSCNWVGSHAPLDTPERSRNGCKEVSSGHPKHEWTSASCITSAFKFLDEAVAQGKK